LNERHYGALQGKDKKETLAQYGEEQFQLWRRSFDVPPPPIDDNDKYSQFGDARYADLGASLPKTECLKDVVNRMIPYLDGELAADLNAGKTVLVTAHGNSIPSG
jgi:2,3-bisphosphoglycerate-dependent phosphoglycerate mutase